MKKGQVTIFMILGIVIVASAFFLFKYVNSESKFDFNIDDITQTKNDKIMVKTYVEKCLEDIGTAGLYFLGNTGGHIYFNDNILLTDNKATSYAIKFNKNEIINPILIEYQDSYGELYNEDISPKKEEIMEEMNKFIENTIPLCIMEADYGNLRLSFGNITADTKFNWFDTSIELDLPITLKNNKKEISLNGYKVNLPFRMNKIINMRNKIIEDLLIHDLSFEELSDTDFEISILPYDGENTIYLIYDKKSGINEIPFIFRFATNNKYNSDPILEFIPDFVVKRNEPFTYIVFGTDSDYDKLSYTSTNPLIPINDEGIINFMPVSKGITNTTICVVDSKNGKDCENVRFKVE